MNLPRPLGTFLDARKLAGDDNNPKEISGTSSGWLRVLVDLRYLRFGNPEIPEYLKHRYFEI